MAEHSQSILVEGLLDISDKQGEFDWRPFREGVEIVPLYVGNDTEGSAALLRYKPGASVPTHKHTALEYILVLDGSQSDGYRDYQAGNMMISGPGTGHRITSENGCIVLAIWEKPVSFLEQE